MKTNKVKELINEGKLEENINWGGYCICDSCDKQVICENMYLIFVLGDVYCRECFEKWVKRTKKYNEKDINEDLKLQKEKSFKWYKYYLPNLEKEEE